MAGPAKADAPPTTRSMVCIDGVAAFTGTGPDERQWLIPLGGRDNHRPVRLGDHVPVDCALVQRYPAAFAESGEPPTVWPIGRLTLEALEALEGHHCPPRPSLVPPGQAGVQEMRRGERHRRGPH